MYVMNRSGNSQQREKFIKATDVGMSSKQTPIIGAVTIDGGWNHKFNVTLIIRYSRGSPLHITDYSTRKPCYRRENRTARCRCKFR